MTDLPDVRPIFIDTSVVIQALRADPVTFSQLAAVETFISATVVGELYFGAHRSAHFDKEVSKIATFIGHSTIVPCDYDTGVLYGAIKNALQQSGTLIPENDMWIAASALQHGLPLATRDGHFANVPGLMIAEW